MTPAEQLAAARTLAMTTDPTTTGVWPRAAALLARQAIERGLHEYWERKAPGLEKRPTHTQLICLPEYLNDQLIAGEIAWTWTALSDACHHRGYDLGPTADELERYIAAAERGLTRLGPTLPSGEGLTQTSSQPAA